MNEYYYMSVFVMLLYNVPFYIRTVRFLPNKSNQNLDKLC